MSTITISLADSVEEETVLAEYYQLEDGWVTFKTADGKLVASYPEKRITRIKADNTAPATNIVVNAVNDLQPEDLARVVAAASKRAIALGVTY
jgi:hypothetical protein